MAADRFKLPSDHPARHTIARFRNAMLSTCSRFFWWQAWNGGVILQNTNRRPRPIPSRRVDKASGREFTTYVPSRPTRHRFADHVLNGVAIGLTNRPQATVWHLVADIESDPQGIAAAALNEQIGGHGFASPSRTTGQHLHFRIIRDAGEAPEQTTERLKRIERRLKATNPHLDALKGIPVIARRDGYLIDDEGVDEASKATLRLGPDAPRALDDLLDITHDTNSNFLAPCLGRGTSEDRLAAVERFLAWHAAGQTITAGQLETASGGFDHTHQPIIVQDAKPASPAAGPTIQRPELLKALQAEQDQDHADTVHGITGRRGTGKLARMLMSQDKPTAWLGAMFVAIQRVGTSNRDAAIDEANAIYSDLPAANDDILDDRRHRKLGGAFDLAVSSFDPALAKPVDPIAAMIRQATSPAWFTDEQIEAMAQRIGSILEQAGTCWVGPVALV